MTREERQLLASVLRHLRELSPFWSQPWQVDESTWAEFSESEIKVYRDHADRTPTWPTGCRFQYRSLTEGVDLAVALGLLPVGLSSAYRAGEAAAESRFRRDLHEDQALAVAAQGRWGR